MTQNLFSQFLLKYDIFVKSKILIKRGAYKMLKEEIKITERDFYSAFDIKGGLIKTLSECTLDGKYYGSAVRITTRN